jgi:hypothetical protein
MNDWHGLKVRVDIPQGFHDDSAQDFIPHFDGERSTICATVTRLDNSGMKTSENSPAPQTQTLCPSGNLLHDALYDVVQGVGGLSPILAKRSSITIP